ncbi:MAG TPA: hypothetical protein VGF79_14705 [Bacteroidia bacterium]
MARYKPHYACFDCRKTFKRRLIVDVDRDKDETQAAKCPQCGGWMADMGLDFASPKKGDIKEWSHIKDLYTVGITFHACGCLGPGYIPKDKESLMLHFQSILKVYHAQLDFWRKRVEPQNESEVQKESNKHWNFIGQIPSELMTKKGEISTEAAKSFWFGRIKDVEEKLNKIRH